MRDQLERKRRKGILDEEEATASTIVSGYCS